MDLPKDVKWSSNRGTKLGVECDRAITEKCHQGSLEWSGVYSLLFPRTKKLTIGWPKCNCRYLDRVVGIRKKTLESYKFKHIMVLASGHCTVCEK